MNISVYACGGCGVNVASKIQDLDVTVNYIDTSDSNLRKLKSPNTFLVDGMDGAGKYRQEAYGQFKDISGDVLIRHKPSDRLNVVIHSLTGGSGGVLGPMVTRELIASGKNTIVIVVDSRSSLIEMENSVKTLQSYAGIANALKLPVGIFYIDNTSKQEADQEAIGILNVLALLTNRSLTAEFDNSDLKSFLQYQKITEYKPAAVILEMTANEDDPGKKGEGVIGTILISKNKNASVSEPTPDYLASCVVIDPSYTTPDLRINSLMGRLTDVIANINARIQTQKDQKRVNRVKTLDFESSNEDGMVI